MRRRRRSREVKMYFGMRADIEKRKAGAFLFCPSVDQHRPRYRGAASFSLIKKES
jgi:hypothetical protein